MSVPPPPPGPDPSTPPVGPYGAPPPPGPYGPPAPYGSYGPYGQYGPPPSYPGAPYGFDAYGRPLSDKSKILAGLLQIFLGYFGVGRFYLGYTGLGIAMLLLSWLTLGIWPLIDGILILLGKVPDKQGRPLRD